ncbi:major facilitator superfamily transporter [Colletotrichum salicis]|uniref:Major facilitator superfamily transporter n=1 Tax=Colletotrichum salicis TaxID=1209931 RepID=A0A135UQM7_9PEZI|nr:major facilitator superfamily transporter [Colletotrichum salicis]
MIFFDSEPILIFNGPSLFPAAFAMNPRQDFNEDTEQALGPALFSFNSLKTLCEDEANSNHSSDAKATPLLNSPSTSESGLNESSDASSPVHPTVTWDGPEDPENPKNWNRRQKWTTSLIISSFAFLSPLSSSIAAPALGPIGHDLHITNDVERQLVLSIFLLTYALGPFVLSPCSEIWGRTPIVRVGNLIFIISTALCGFATSKGQILAFRFLAGIGGSATIGMGSGVLTDCWKPEERGKGLAFMQFAPVLGLALGPIGLMIFEYVAGGYISQCATWRWTFWSVVILNFTVQIVAFVFLRETYAPRILHLKAKRRRKLYNDASFQTEWEKQDRTLAVVLRTSLSRPWIMLATQPIIQSLALYQAFNFGLLYLIISSFPRLWENYYGMHKGQASLNYISIALGALIGVLIFAPTMDLIYQRLKRRNGIEKDEKGVPEFRIPLMVPASLLTPCGIIFFAWTAQNKMHFMLPNVRSPPRLPKLFGLPN